jgi:hypothetical protein
MNAIALIKDGRRDFDFLHGDWAVAHRRLKRRGAGCHDWDAFSGTSCCRSLMGGVGNVDENHMTERAFQGVTFRTFDVARRTWSIYWVNAAAGLVGEPVHGRFQDGVGRFYGHDLDDGRAVKVAFVWVVESPDRAHWSQAFSYDNGRTWEENWAMAFTRLPERRA